jgi:hypothetical protein
LQRYINKRNIQYTVKKIKEVSSIIKKRAFFRQVNSSIAIQRKIDNIEYSAIIMQAKNALKYLLVQTKKHGIKKNADEKLLQIRQQCLKKQYFSLWIKQKYKASSVRTSTTVHQISLKKKVLRTLLKNALYRMYQNENNGKALLLHCFHVNKVALDSFKLFISMKERTKLLKDTSNKFQQEQYSINAD